MHILIAPNAFKNSLSAPDAAKAIRDGLLDSGLPMQHYNVFLSETVVTEQHH